MRYPPLSLSLPLLRIPALPQLMAHMCSMYSASTHLGIRIIDRNIFRVAIG